MLLFWFHFNVIFWFYISSLIYPPIYLFIYFIMWLCASCIRLQSAYRFIDKKKLSTAKSRNLFYFMSIALLVLQTVTLKAVLKSCCHILLRIPLCLSHTPF